MRERLAGADAIVQALDAGRPLALVLVVETEASAEAQAAVARAEALGVPVSRESAREMRRMSAEESAPDRTGGGSEILALLGAPTDVDLDSLMTRAGLVMLLAGLRYPGNVGFVLRSAEVAGAAGVVVDADWSAEVREEARRVSIRADRFMPVLYAEAAHAVAAARSRGRRIVAIETGGRATLGSVDLRGDVLVVFGSETEGVPETLLAQADEVVHIPTRGFIPSYNVQAAAGMLIGDWLRQTDPEGGDER